MAPRERLLLAWLPSAWRKGRVRVRVKVRVRVRVRVRARARVRVGVSLLRAHLCRRLDRSRRLRHLGRVRAIG